MFLLLLTRALCVLRLLFLSALSVCVFALALCYVLSVSALLSENVAQRQAGAFAMFAMFFYARCYCSQVLRKTTHTVILWVCVLAKAGSALPAMFFFPPPCYVNRGHIIIYLYYMRRLFQFISLAVKVSRRCL